MKRFLLLILHIFLMSATIQSQSDCIDADSVVCLNACSPVTYSGTAPADALYIWSSTCGTFTNPNQQQPGEHCYLFAGTCMLQVIIQEGGMAPDTCTIDVSVGFNPDAVLEGDASICSGSCVPLITTFLAGTPPFAYGIDDGTFVNFYSSGGLADTILVCPLFTTTYTLVSITDANGCSAADIFNSVDVNVVPGVEGAITQNGNMLCANPPGQNYQWYDCGFTTLQSISPCLTLTSDGCYCLIVSDGETGLCVDTVCGDFIIPCDLTCEISAAETVCIGSPYRFIYTGNASDTAMLEWLVDIPGLPPYSILNEDTIEIQYSGIECVHVTLTIVDGICMTTCSDSTCAFLLLAMASFPDDIVSCDSCISIPITLEGIPPFEIHISDGVLTDTISGITDTLFQYAVCPDPDSTVVFILFQVTDSVSACPGTLLDDSVSVTVHTAPAAIITQTGNNLCADPVSGSYGWYDCEMTQLLSFDSCLTIVDTGCYCLVVSTPFCSDTICDEFNSQPCELTCDISLVDSACLSNSVYFIYTGNASSSAVFNWLIDIPGFPMMPISGNDTVILSYDVEGCYQVSLTVFDAGCIVTCTDSVCIVGPQSTVSVCCGEEKCDTCTTLEFTFTGPAPWSLILTDGQNQDTISGIMTSPYQHTVCPPADTTITYTIVQANDNTNTCPAAIAGDSVVTVTLHPYPDASIVQSGDTLCAFPAGMAGYGWFVCPSGPYLDTTQCFVPTLSGCYCVIVSTAFDCVDTACATIIISSVSLPEPGELKIFPNPTKEFVQFDIAALGFTPVPWMIINPLGMVVDRGIITEPFYTYFWKEGTSAGIYILQTTDTEGNLYTYRLIRL